MKWYKKIILGVSVLIVLVLLLNLGFNLWIKYRLPDVINEKNNSAYAISYKKLEVSLWNSNILANDIVIVPKAALNDSMTKAGIYGEVKSVKVNGFKIWSSIFSDRIKAESIIIDEPKIVLYKKNDKAINQSKSIRSAVVAPFEKIISVSDIFLQHGDLKIVYVKNNAAILSVQNINLQLNGIIITDKVLEQKIPFHFREYALRCDSIYYRPSEFYHITTGSIQTTKTDLKLSDFKMIPEYSRREFIQKIKTEKDIYTLSSQTIAIHKMDWGFKTSGDFFFYSKAVALENTVANIYRNKLPPDDLTKKYLYNKLLRDLKFDLKIDTLQLNNAHIEYEEEKDFNNGAGKLTFSKFNLTATNISSGFKKQKLANLNIRIKCRFMDTSLLDVRWTFNVMDKTDGFNIKGTLLNFDAEKIVPFTKPYMNVATKGIINEVHFDFTGNDKKDSGAFAVKYDDLKFAVYQKDDRKKKNKFLSAIGNLFVKNDTKGKIKDAQVEVERIPEKSFYNFLWRSVAEGLKKILI